MFIEELKTRLKIRKANLGKRASETTRKKMSELRIGEKHWNWQRGKSQSKCEICNKKTGYKRVRCKRHRIFTLEMRRNIGNGHKGEKNFLWKGGITPINQKIRMSFEYKLWREAVFKRDNWTCVWCGAISKKENSVILNADHIKPFAYYPELRFAIDNGRTLCVPCHKTTDTYANRAKQNLIGKNVEIPELSNPVNKETKKLAEKFKLTS